MKLRFSGLSGPIRNARLCIVLFVRNVLESLFAILFEVL